MKQPRTLQCACCGSGTIGRQWWNRDTGFGLCPACVPFILDHGSDQEELERSYGKPGIHFATQLTKQAQPGQLVASKAMNGDWTIGTLKEWDNGTAIINTRDGQNAICCD